MSRDEFLTRVRQAAVAGRAYRVHTRSDLPHRVAYLGPSSNLVARLVAEIDLVGGRAQVVANLDEAHAALHALLNQYRPHSALCWRHPLLDRLGLRQLLDAAEIDLLDVEVLSAISPTQRRERLLAAEVGITSATAAIAETGTLAMYSGPGSERLASLLPPVHIAIIEREQIVPDLYDLFSKLEADGRDMLPSNLTLITGPSKTGDLELRLVTGVHGPGKWHVIVIDSVRAID